MVATVASSSIIATPPSVGHPQVAFTLAAPSPSVHHQYPEISPPSRSGCKAEASSTVCAKRKVHFAAVPQTLYFLPSRPTNVTVEPLAELVVEPLNCSHLGQGKWLASVSQMREEPFCQLDYLRAGTEVDQHPGDMLWPLEDDDDPIAARSSGSTCNVPMANEFFLVGEVAAYNLDYKKEVIIHYTMDAWKGKATVRARYTSSIAVLRIDKFKFTIPVSSPCPRSLEIAIEYQVCSRSYWDSLNGLNYRFSLSLVPLVLGSSDPSLLITEDEGVESLPARREGAVIPPTLTKDSASPTTLTIPIPIGKPKKQTVSLLSSSPAHVAVWSSAAGPFSLSRMPKGSFTPASPVRGVSQTSSSWDCTKSFTLMAMRASRDCLRPEKRFPQTELLSNSSLAMPFF